MVKANAAHPSARRVARARQRREIRPEQYRYIERWDGFRIEHPLRHTVDVRLEGWHFRIATRGRVERCPIVASPVQLSRLLAAALLGRRERTPQWRSSGISRESWTIARTMKRVRQTLLERHAPSVLRVEQRMVAMHGELPRLARAPAFYRA
ncbi:MAG: hypothetical protein ACRERC_19645, partial [Candidatus Binatia bacterium]